MSKITGRFVAGLQVIIREIMRRMAVHLLAGGLLGIFLLAGLSACTLTSCSNDPACLRVLFIGNSYTYVNDLPATLTRLADSGGQRIETGMAATGGWFLSDHLKSAETLNQITGSKWNYIVLQEQSQAPASDSARNSQMYPAAHELASKIKDVGAKPILFITWAHRDGWTENGTPTYQAMQDAIDNGYTTLGQQLPAAMAPVGFAWMAVRQEKPELNLWQEDGSHPSEAGTYLAACVFYAVIFGKNPEGLSFHGNLSADDALLLQKTAAGTVLNNKQMWNLPR